MSSIVGWNEWFDEVYSHSSRTDWYKRIGRLVQREYYPSVSQIFVSL
jgi:hypothetical protein